MKLIDHLCLYYHLSHLLPSPTTLLSSLISSPLLSSLPSPLSSYELSKRYLFSLKLIEHLRLFYQLLLSSLLSNLLSCLLLRNIQKRSFFFETNRPSTFVSATLSPLFSFLSPLSSPLFSLLSYLLSYLLLSPLSSLLSYPSLLLGTIFLSHSSLP